ncbi:DUF5085 family protein [Fredinandcohnia sp. 179-A 10B2 NHS]|uniref:DUF5085 family protein n=1 Tax=Fredinandcohnia sp. 179-A 10B2 NHS TaxID=3235176 RepID=UPI0039A081B4
MINPYDSIRYSNVLSSGYRCHYKDLNQTVETFLNKVIKQEATPKGPLFYSLTNVPKDEIVQGILYMPIEESYIESSGDLYFHSYFSIEDMISLCIHTDIERNTEVAYHMLLTHIEEVQLRPATPFFHVVSGDDTFQYVFIKIGVAEALS